MAVNQLVLAPAPISGALFRVGAELESSATTSLGGVSRTILDNRNHLHITRWSFSGDILSPWQLSDNRRSDIFLALKDAGYVDKVRESLKGRNKGREQFSRGVATRFLECGRHTAMNLVCNDCGHREPVKQSCNLVICPSCREKRMGRLASRLRPMYEHMTRPRYLTLTVPNVLGLRSGMMGIGVAFSKLRRSSCWSGVVGGVSTREATFNYDDGSWNVHIHTLYDGYIDFSRVLNRWNALTGSEWIKDVEGYGRDVVAEVIGYCGKVPEFPTPELYVEYYEALRGIRLTQTYGSFFKFVPPLDMFLPACPKCGSLDVKYAFCPGGRGFGPP